MYRKKVATNANQIHLLCISVHLVPSFSPCSPCFFFFFFFHFHFVIVSQTLFSIELTVHSSNYFQKQIEQWSNVIRIQWLTVFNSQYKNIQHTVIDINLSIFTEITTTNHRCDGRHFSTVNAFSWFLIKVHFIHKYIYKQTPSIRVPEYAINDSFGRWKSQKKAVFISI